MNVEDSHAVRDEEAPSSRKGGCTADRGEVRSASTKKKRTGGFKEDTPQTPAEHTAKDPEDGEVPDPQEEGAYIDKSERH